MTTSLGVTCAVAPCNMKVSRKDQFTVTAGLKGYEPATIPVRAVVGAGGAGAAAGNVIAGGLVGIAVGSVTGATLKHKPNSVIQTLQPVDPTNPATPPP